VTVDAGKVWTTVEGGRVVRTVVITVLAGKVVWYVDMIVVG
jgi:hypothetical protein